MTLVNYSSSSDSDDEKCTSNLGKIQKTEDITGSKNSRPLLAQASLLLGKRKLNTIEDDVTDDPLKHDGRIRSFRHERGNWATYIFIHIETNLLEDIQDICLMHLENKFNFKQSSEMHISLSKTVVLQYHFIKSFIESLKINMQTMESFTVSLNNLKVYTNVERTRTFLALKVDNLYISNMLNILQKVDHVMKEFKLATFYEDPSFHVSVLWCTGDCVSLVSNLIPSIMESLTERLPVHLKIDKICCKSGFKEFQFKLKIK